MLLTGSVAALNRVGIKARIGVAQTPCGPTYRGPGARYVQAHPWPFCGLIWTLGERIRASATSAEMVNDPVGTECRTATVSVRSGVRAPSAYLESTGGINGAAAPQLGRDGHGVGVCFPGHPG